MQDASALFETLHPLEIKVLTVLGAHQAHSPSCLREEPLAQASGLDPSQISMAIGWLLAKSLIRVEEEILHTSVSLTDVGEHYRCRLVRARDCSPRGGIADGMAARRAHT